MKRVLITGGAGFVGSTLALGLKQRHPEMDVVVLDNLRRRGSELNLAALKQAGVAFHHGDIRCTEDLTGIGVVDVLIECSAEPSVLAGIADSPAYVLNTNLVGAAHCLEFARKHGAAFIFLSTSRIYPIEALNSLAVVETDSRFELEGAQGIPGAGRDGITEAFPLEGARSLYGATKLAAELLIQEYEYLYGMKTVINRCGVIAGPGQFGKIDQGIVAFWAASHLWQRPLKYFGYGGSGKQTRDILHATDLLELIDIQLGMLDEVSGSVFNVGGGRRTSVSLAELTELCRTHTGNEVSVEPMPQEREADVRIYLSDCHRVTELTGWRPTLDADDIVRETVAWLRENEDKLKEALN